jgi:hypothetical protein
LVAHKRNLRADSRIVGSPLFEIALVLVRFNHIASFIINADYKKQAGIGEKVKSKACLATPVQTRGISPPVVI